MWCKVWDDKEDPCMLDEVLESNGHPRIMAINFPNMAHSFVLTTIINLGPCHINKNMKFFTKILDF